MKSRNLVINLKTSFVSTNLFSHDFKAGKVNLLHNLSRLPRGLKLNHIESVHLLSEYISNLKQTDFKDPLISSPQDLNVILTYTKGAHSLPDILNFGDYSIKTKSNIHVEDEKYLSLLSSLNLSGAHILTIGQGLLTYVDIEKSEDGTLQKTENTIDFGILKIGDFPDLVKILQSMWADEGDYIMDFNLLQNMNRGESFGIKSDEVLFSEYIIFDYFLRKLYKKNKALVLSEDKPLFVSGIQVEILSNTGFVISSLLSSLPTRGVFKLYLDNNSMLKNALGLSLEEPALRELLSVELKKYLVITMVDEKDNLLDGDVMGEIEIVGEKTITPYKNSIWLINSDQSVSQDLSIRYDKQISTPSKNVKGVKVDGIAIDTTDRLAVKYSRLREWFNSILEHDEIRHESSK